MSGPWEKYENRSAAPQEDGPWAKYDRRQAAEPTGDTQSPGLLRRYLGDVAEGFKMAGPLGASIGASKVADEAIRGLAYDAGGAVTDALSGVVSPETAAGAGYAANVGIQAIPAVVGGQGAAKLGAPVMRSAAESVMQSALKPGVKEVLKGNAARAINTMLDEGVNVTPGGVAKLRGMINRLNMEVQHAIARSPATVDKAGVADELRGVLDKFSKQVTPSSDLNVIQNAWTEFLQHPLLLGKNDIPVQLAQEMKQGTYRILKDKFGEVGSAGTEAQKALARGLKEGVANAVPGVDKLNAQESALINALQEIEHRVAVSGNKNPVGLAWLADNPAALASFMADRSEAFKSIAAQMLNAGQRIVPAAAGSVAGGVVGGVSGKK